MIRKWDNENQKIGSLQDAYNKYGEFKVATHFKQADKKDDIEWSKHVSVLECWHVENKFWRLIKSNNRTLFKTEILLDYDPKEGESKEETLKNIKLICDDLKKRNIEYKVFFSGSRGYHIHCIFSELDNYNFQLRTKIRYETIKYYGCDLQKASENNMIALEWELHWKTGNKKIEVFL